MEDDLGQLQSLLAYRFKDASLLECALRHASAPAAGPSNERLEFLGDAVVGLAVSADLFRTMPHAAEGEMTVIKSAVVSRRTLARAGRTLGLGEHMNTDRGLRSSRYPVSVLAGAYEAVAGAIFVDGGLRAARRFVLRTLRPEIERAGAARHAAGYKSILQERTQAEGKGLPAYEVVRRHGPDHRREFEVLVRVEGRECGTGRGTTKKEAEQEAAREALDRRYPEWDAEGG